MTDTPEYVNRQADGDLTVGTAAVSLDGILASWAEGLSPETIRADYPALTLEEVYGAIAWALARPGVVEAYLQHRADEWARYRARTASGPAGGLARRLRADAELAPPG
jgi:uncharacterized protein (DUF433 family)